MLVVSSLLLFNACCLSCWSLSFVGSLFVCCCWLVLLRAVSVDACCVCLFVFCLQLSLCSCRCMLLVLLVVCLR